MELDFADDAALTHFFLCLLFALFDQVQQVKHPVLFSDFLHQFLVLEGLLSSLLQFAVYKLQLIAQFDVLLDGRSQCHQ